MTSNPTNDDQKFIEFDNAKLQDESLQLFENATKTTGNVYVLKYGSDPLKTYLPDSDIDLTIIVSNYFKVGDQQIYIPPLNQLKIIKTFLEKFKEIEE